MGDEQVKQVYLANGFCMLQETELESAGVKQVRQDCLLHGVCVVQVLRFSCKGVSGVFGNLKVQGE